MATSVFIDGGHGTTGLEIRERLMGIEAYDLIEIAPEQRKDDRARCDAIETADIAILCLPDGEARKIVDMVEGGNTRIIDASSAHRTDPGWIYGFAELADSQAEAIATAARVSNPGCYAVTFIALIRPLVQAGLIATDSEIAVNAVSGYSGGGKAMIAEFESSEAPTAHRTYALDLAHKHLPEMAKHSDLAHHPLFAPSVANTYRGMLVDIPLFPGQLEKGPSLEDVRQCYDDSYGQSAVISLAGETELGDVAAVPIERCAGTDCLEIMVFKNSISGHIRLIGALDNLGKGAAGSAVQNLNLMAGIEPHTGLRL